MDSILSEENVQEVDSYIHFNDYIYTYIYTQNMNNFYSFSKVIIIFTGGFEFKSCLQLLNVNNF